MSRSMQSRAVTSCCAALGCLVLALPAVAGDPPLFPQPTYGPAGELGPETLVTGDIDGDGLLDLLAPAAGFLQVARGRPDGSFAPVESHAAPQAEDLLGLGDVDGDGDLDAVTDFDAATETSWFGLQVLLNDGDGHFTAGSWTHPGQSSPIRLVDVDGDSLDDIVVAYAVWANDSVVQVFRSQGNGSFDPPTDYHLPAFGWLVEPGDVDLDGDVDLVLGGSERVLQLVNQGDGSFLPGPIADTSFFPGSGFQLVDATGDGRLDATGWDTGAPALGVLPGQPDGSFGRELLVPLPFVADRARFAHFDDDAIVDLAVVGSEDDDGTVILRGLGDLAFESLQQFPMQPTWLDAADVNIDGRPDLLAHAGHATVALGLETGGFDSALNLSVDEDLTDVAVLDVDGDGLADLLECHAGSVQVKLQQVSGELALVQELPTIGARLHPCHADGDGLIDLVVSDESALGRAAVALNLGDGTFSTFSAPIVAGRDVLLADMDGDGNDDLVGWAQPNPTYELRITYGDGLGGFAGTATWSTTVAMKQLAAADIDQDGRIDIITGTGSSSSSAILKWVNTGSGFLHKSFNPPLSGPAADLACGDFNGDGDPDLLMLPGQVSLGAPAGQFDAPVSLASLDGGVARVADLDADGFDDALVAREAEGTALVTRGGPAGLEPNAGGFHGAVPEMVTMAVGDVDGDGRRDVVVGSHDPSWLLNGTDPLSIHLQKAPGPFSDLGSPLAGSKGEPELTGVGTLAGGSSLSLRVTSAKSFAPARLIVGAQLLQAPFKGGVLVPLPTIMLPPIPTDAVGKLVLSTTWPSALPSGVSLYAQAWITDAAGPAGLAATNGLVLTTP